MSGYLFDSNVLPDIITANVTWRAWSKAQLAIATAKNLGYSEVLVESFASDTGEYYPYIYGTTPKALPS